MIEIIAFDADDTLWHNEFLYSQTKAKFVQLFSRYQPADRVGEMLDEIEVHNLRYYGYGIKSFGLSMVETALKISDGQARGDELSQVLDFVREMLTAEVELIDMVEESLAQLAPDYDLMLITKGDNFEQRRKVNRSRLAGYYKYIEVVAEKNVATYRELLGKFEIRPENFLMVGNSLRSDILPVIALGGQAVYIPYEQIWEHEQQIDQAYEPDSFYELESITQLPELVKRIR
jgi:putative hydrolase of the HAD superfamily